MPLIYLGNKMTKRIPNLETAIAECRRLGFTYNYEHGGGKSHIKFYIDGFNKLLIMSSKHDNRDKVKKDIMRIVNER